MQITKKGMVAPSAFNHVHTSGRSIQRDTIATDDELTRFTQNFLSGKEDRQWYGVVSAKCEDIRNIQVSDDQRRAICVFDTAEKNNRAHGELCRAYVMEEADRGELRHALWSAFKADMIVSPSDYRGSAILSGLPESLRNRSLKKQNWK